MKEQLELRSPPQPLKLRPPFQEVAERDLVLKTIEQLQHPFYFYNLDQLQQHLQHLTEKASGVAKLWYACKANPLSHVIQHIHRAGLSFDIASPGELGQVLRQGVKPEQVLATGPAKSKNLIRRYLEHGVGTFVVESFHQMQWLQECCEELGQGAQALLRLQLCWDSGESSVLGGNDVTPFGLEASEWKKINLADYPRVHVQGIHTFQWGNLLDEQKIAFIWKTALKNARDVAATIGMELSVVDLGGGIGIPYKDQHHRVQWDQLMAELTTLKASFSIPEIWLELGRFAVGEMGGYATRVVDMKVVRGQQILVLDSGINQLARPTLTKQSFPCSALTKSSFVKKSFQIHGPLCTALDQLGTFSLPEDIAIGDWLYFHQCGAYGFTESMPYFLCHSLPGEAVLQQGEVEVVRTPKPASHYLV